VQLSSDIPDPVTTRNSAPDRDGLVPGGIAC